MTLSEIVVAIGILAVMTLVVVGVFTKLLMASTKSSDLTTAEMLADSILDRAVRHGPGGTDAWGVGGDFSTTGGRASMYTHDTEVKTKFVYQLTPTELSRDTHGVLYQIQVLVTWWEDSASDSAGRFGLGKLSTETSRTVYVRQ